MTQALPPSQIRIRRVALAKLLLYADGCPVEIGGLGTVAWQGGDLLVSDLFILPQRVSASDTELEPDALFAFLERLARTDGDIATVRLWWHSHGDMDLLWSETDCATIENLPGDFWVAILVNRKGELRCRLDAFVPRRETWEVPLVEVPEEPEVNLEALRVEINREILEQVQVCLAAREAAQSEEATGVMNEPSAILGSPGASQGAQGERR